MMVFRPVPPDGATQMPITIGLDLAKRTSWYAAVDETDRLIDDGKIPSTAEAIQRIVKRFDPDMVLVEASSITAWAVDTLVDMHANVWPVHPGSLPTRRQRRKKTDKVDAHLLVRLYRAGMLTKAWIPTKGLRDLRNLVRGRHRLAVDRTKFRNRIHATLNQEGERVRIDDMEVDGKGVFSAKGRRFVLNEHPELAGLFEVQDLLSVHMKKLNRRIEQIGQEIEAVRTLRTVPGIGPMVSLAFYSEIGDIDRFEKAEQVVAYLGLDPMVEQSGDTVKHLGISHKGPGWLRGIFTEAAWTHVRHAPDSYITHKHNELVKRIGKKKAAVATTRRLVKTAFWVWKEGVPFESSGRTPGLACRHATAVA